MGRPPPHIRHTHKKSRLSQHEIVFDPEKPWSPFKYELIQILEDYEVLEIRAHLGHFELSLLLLNEDRKLNLTEGMSESGQSGQVCFIDINDQEFAIKAIKTKKKRVGKIISQTIQEYCIHVISSALGCAKGSYSYCLDNYKITTISLF